MDAIEADSNYTVVEYLDNHSGYRCGYCKSADSNFSNAIWAHRMKVGHYQALIDRGWRRSGKYCYKPAMDKVCCPQYTIKCDASEFKLSKSQKKVLKRMHHFLSHGSIKAQEKVSIQDSSEVLMKDDREPSLLEQITNVAKLKTGNSVSLIEVPLNEIAKSQGTSEESTLVELSRAGTSKSEEVEPSKKSQKTDSKLGASTAKIKNNTAKTVEDYLNEKLPQNAAHELKVCLIECNTEGSEFKDTLLGSCEIYGKYQMTIHGDSPAKCGVNNYHRFLCQSPLKFWKPAFGPESGYGSFHQQYWLDGELIAVGVLDILPHCVSSVYLYYDPKYSFLSLGTYASLREIALTRMIHKKLPGFKYYYMGFYIHSCPKMRYKGNYYPSALLCPETYTWQPIEKCLPKLEVTKYCRLSARINSALTKESDEISLDKVFCLFRGTPILFKEYRKKHRCKKEEIASVKQYANFVGNVCAYSMLLYRDD